MLISSEQQNDSVIRLDTFFFKNFVFILGSLLPCGLFSCGERGRLSSCGMGGLLLSQSMGSGAHGPQWLQHMGSRAQAK